MSITTHINQGPVKIHVDITASTIENYDMSLGRRRTIASCDLSAIQRIVKDLTLMENKAKYTIFYGTNGKEKRFGGMGFAIEGNASDFDFQSFISELESKLPPNVVWQDKAEEKASGISKTGDLIYPIAAQMPAVGRAMPNHAGMRNAIIAIQWVAATVAVFISFIALYAVFFTEQNFAMTVFSLIIGIGMLIFPFLLAQTAFIKGGLHSLILNKDKVVINHAFKSVDLPINAITSFRNRIVELNIVQQGAQSTSIEYEFQINHHKFSMGENAALKFLEKAKSFKLCIV